MKKNIFLLFLLNFNYFLAQITITDNNFKEEEKIYPKPIPFDSLSNWVKFDNVRENKQYLGLKVYIPKSSYNKANFNKYSIITDVIYGENLNNWWLEVDENCSSCPKYLNENENLNYLNRKSINLIFKLKDENSENISYFTYDYLKKNILVQFFESQQKFYKNKVFIYDDLKYMNKYNYYESVNCDRLLYDIKKIITSENKNQELNTSPKKVKLKKGSKWKCVDVTLMKDIEVYSKDYFAKKFQYPEPDYFRYKLFYIFKNDLDETIAFENINPLSGEQITNFKDFEEPYGLLECNDFISPDKVGDIKENSSFILENLYVEREKQNKISTEASIAKKKEDERKIQIREASNSLIKQKKLIEKYGDKYGNLIFRNQLTIGMSKEMSEESWGKTYNRSRITTDGKLVEIWEYSRGTSLYFINDILTQIVEQIYR